MVNYDVRLRIKTGRYMYMYKCLVFVLCYVHEVNLVGGSQGSCGREEGLSGRVDSLRSSHH